MEEADIEVRLVDVWDVETIADLYRAGGWWNEKWNPASLGGLLPGHRGRGVGTMILSALLDYCTSAGVAWVALVAEPGTETFYTALGFRRMEGHIPMRWYPKDW